MDEGILIQVRKSFTSSEVGVSVAVVGTTEGVSLTGRFVLPKFLNLPIKPLGVIGVGGSVLESSGEPRPAFCRTTPEGPLS